MKFKVSAPKVNVSGAEFEYDFGENLQDAAQKYGEDTVFKLYRQQAVVRAQAVARTHLTAGKSIDEVQQVLNGWKPDATMSRAKSPVEKLAAKFAKLSPEEKQALLESIKQGL